MQKLNGDPPLSKRIYADLRQRLDAGEWGYGAVLPTENELSAVYQVSRGTIRMVLGELENEGYVRRERGRGTFVARAELIESSRRNTHSTLSFIVPYVRDSYVSSILLGIENAARLSGYSVLFSHVENDLEKQEQALRSASDQGAAGIVLYPVASKVQSVVLPELISRRYPIVLVDRYIRGISSDYVMSDNFGGGLMATQHLLGLGHRRIAFLSWTEQASTFEHRKMGYRQAMQEAGISPDPALEWEVIGYPEIDQGALEKRLSEAWRPTAIFTANDQLALAVLRAARSLDISIPEEIALVGFDNLDISAHVNIPLTTVAQPAFEIGKTAAELVMDRIAQKIPPDPQARILPVKLMIRMSCGAQLHLFEKGGGR
jgi:GntR family transcriptional regulator of arabinose operon